MSRAGPGGTGGGPPTGAGGLDDLAGVAPQRGDAWRWPGLPGEAAQWPAERAARRPKPAKLAANAALQTYVQDRLAGVVATSGGAAVRGPVVPWKGRG